MAFPTAVVQLITQAGETVVADGANAAVRADRLGGVVNSDSAGMHYEYARKGRLFTASMQAGASLGTSLITTAAATMTLANPAASQVNLSILGCTVVPSAVEVTTALEGYYIAYYFSAAFPSANSAVALTYNALLTAGQGTAGTPGTGVAYTACTVLAGKIVRIHPFSAVNFATATLSTGSVVSAYDPVEGALILAPNTAVTVLGVGTTGISGLISISWAEIPI